MFAKHSERDIVPHTIELFFYPHKSFKCHLEESKGDARCACQIDLSRPTCSTIKS